MLSGIFIFCFKFTSKFALGPVFVSGDATAVTLIVFLREVKKLVEGMASQLVDGKLYFISFSIIYLIIS